MFIRALILTFCFLCIFSPVQAQESNSAFRSTAYPLPRFVSLDSDKVYVRTGPGQRYPIKYVFKKKGLPVEIILEYEVWRKIKDYEGDTGWVHQSLLSGERTGLIWSEDIVPMYDKDNVNSRHVASVEPGVLVSVKSCGNDWCKIDASGYKGWVEGKFIWGVYKKESF